MDDLVVTAKVTIPAGELVWRFDPSGGPGGQHANRSATRVEVSLNVAASVAFDEPTRQRVLGHLGDDVNDGVVTVRVGKSRSQWRNRQMARQRLAEMLREALRPPPAKRRVTRPGRAARDRRLAAKRARSETKRLRRRPPDFE
jgi:ribosome-associated protein